MRDLTMDALRDGAPAIVRQVENEIFGSIIDGSLEHFRPMLEVVVSLFWLGSRELYKNMHQTALRTLLW